MCMHTFFPDQLFAKTSPVPRAGLPRKWSHWAGTVVGAQPHPTSVSITTSPFIFTTFLISEDVFRFLFKAHPYIFALGPTPSCLL